MMADEGQPGRKRAGRGVSRRGFLKGAAIGTGLAATDLAFLANIADAAPNPISVENAKPGTPPSVWEILPDESIEGFTTEFSVNAGSPVRFKIKTDSKNYRLDIYRMGWYGGNGARKVATVNPSVPLPQNQPAPITDPNGTGIIDCGNWAVSATWNVPADAVSGVYFANLIRLEGSNAENRVMFVVRNDGRAADVMYQTSDTTYQAYNMWGGNSLYVGTAEWGRATKVSYNRPHSHSGVERHYFYAEHPCVRWLERNGYNVTYCSGIDTDRAGNQLLNKKVFISSGHDEYWSGQQRTNVEAARDAGVNLIFMSGNEVFWKTRWESSVDGTGTPYRTLVCYKETIAGAKVDPSPEWTGTWRDPRFSPPSNGGRPENGLTGQFFKAINPVENFDFNIRVPYEYSRLRIWRNSSVATLQPGQTAILANSSLGFEWDTDENNSARPPGLIRLSQTTETADQILQDHGATYASGPLTHYLTMYKAASGALVWGTGTVQWSWGLDDQHSTNPDQTIAQNVRMQQATLNVLADMAVQPATKQSNLVAATKSTDTLPPITTITAPAAGATVPIGSPITITGTAADQGGGRVAGVEVSTDGVRWHPATGTTSWSYTFTPLTLGPLTVRARAIDDSCNRELPGASRSLTGGPRSLPCSIWPAGTTPAIAAENDSTPLELGVKFRASVDGFVSAIRFYKGAGNTGTHVGHLWAANGTLLGTTTFTGETATGWQQANFAQPIAITAGNTYVASYWAPNGHYAKNANYFATAYDLPPLRALASGEDGPDGVFRPNSSGFPNQTFGASNYWVDVVFDTDDHLAPTVADRSPAIGIEAVALTSPVSATFSEAMNGASIVFQLRDPANALVPGSVAYDGPNRRVTFTPSAALLPRTTYMATVASAADTVGTPMAAPVTWSFTTTAAAGDVPTSIWDSSAVPAVGSSGDTNAVEVGMKFTSAIDGEIRGLRFYKGSANIGTHVGHLWTAGGVLLGTVTFANESGSGWQQANFASPIPIQKNTVYLATYLTLSGQYSKTELYFTSPASRGPLTAIANGVSGPNGVYRYGGGFPSDTWNATNYWVDVMFGLPPDTTGPTLDDRAPAPGLAAVATSSTVWAQFNEPINPATLSFGLRGPGGVVVPASVGYDAGTRRATLTPNSALAIKTQYTAEISATDTSGNAMPAPVTWTFTTVAAAGQVPATIWNSSAVPAVPAQSDTGAVEVGMKFRADIDGAVRAIRFYKGAGNTGTHVGHLWTSTGTLLGSVTFTNETATGWQQANFASPIQITGGTTYVASYHAPNGRYALTAGGFSSAGVDSPPLHALRDGTDGANGVFSYGPGGFPTSSFGSGNYWVDVVFDDVIGPSVVAKGPLPNATSVALDVRPSATFSEPVVPGSVTFELRDSVGALVPAVFQYDAASRTATIVPNNTLATAQTFTASVSNAVDGAGNPMTPVSWSFTTVGPGLLSLFDPSDVPATPASSDTGAVEVGTRFRSTVAGEVHGVRFYKGAGNAGPHAGHLWSAAGTLLATATFAGESPSGWQYAAFSTPVAIQPDTIYVISYHAPSGRYATSSGYFGGGNVTNGPLVGPGAGSGEANGVYVYAAGAGFPTNTFGSTNYWVDVTFLPS